MPSRSVEAATRNEAIAAAREEHGPAVKIVGVRRIRSGGVLGFFAAERYVAEVDLTAAGTPTDGGADRRAAAPGPGSDEAPRRTPRSRPGQSVDERMSELADLLGPSAGAVPVATYSAAGVAQAPPRRDDAPRRTATAGTAPGAARTTAPDRTGTARSTAGAVTGTRSATTTAPRGGATPRSGAVPAARATGGSFAPGSFAAAVQAAAAAPGATPFTPSRYRPTLDRIVDPAPEAPAEPAPESPSPFTAALARMVADRSVSSAVSDAVERSTGAAEDEPADGPPADTAEPAVFRVRAEEWVDESPEDTEGVEVAVQEAPVPAPVAAPSAPVAAAPAPAPAAVPAPAATAPTPAASPVPPAAAAPAAPAEPPAPVPAAPAPAPTPVAAAPVPTPVPAPPVADAPPATDRRAALQSALQSALRSAGPADPDMERLLEGVVERVLAGAAAPAPAGTTAVDEPSSRGRHRVPEPVALGSPAAGGFPATTELPAVRPAAAHPEPVRPVPVRPVPARVLESRRDVVLDMWGNEVPAREPRVLAPVGADWPPMARTASDPAPRSVDATAILPPLSLLPARQPTALGGRPPLPTGRPAVPPARRPLAPGPSTASRPAIAGRPAVPAPAPRAGSEHAALARVVPVRGPARDALPTTGTRLATVTRLTPHPSGSSAMAPYGVSAGDELVVRLLALGLPEFLIAPGFAADAAAHGLYAALTRTLGDRLAPAPHLPGAPGSVLLVVGPGPEALAAARSLAVSERLDPAAVQWATPGDSAVLSPEHSRITTLETAAERRRASERSGTLTIVAVDAPLRTGGGSWLAHMLSIWSPEAVWGVVDATRKLEDLVPWLDGLPRLDAVMVQETDSTADPAAVLSHLTAPVARIDGARATAHRWASLLCERLEEL